MMTPKKQPTFGLSRMGTKPRKPAMRIAIPLGLTLSGLAAAGIAVMRDDYPAWWQVFMIFWICLAPLATALAWVLVVDRATLPGAARNPEQSIETVLSEKAASASFFITLGAVGLLAAVAITFGYDSIGNPLAWTGVGMMALFAVNYQVVRHKS